MPNDRYYDTAKHKAWRAAVLRKAKHKCQECAKYGKSVAATHAHHIKARLDYPELKHVVSNGMALCTGCHNKIESRIKIHQERRKSYPPHPRKK